MRATVVVPTRNRAASLDRLLHALAEQSVPAADFEIVVVDNGSTDATPTVVAAWAERHPGLRRIAEPVAGVSRARNAGIAAAGAPILAFTDDDTVPDPAWLASLLRGYERDPAVALVTGRAVLRLEGPTPAWFGPETVSWFSPLDFGPDPRLLTDRREVPWTLNLSVRTAAARAAGGFPEHLGRVGANLRSGEEAPFVAAVRAGGGLVAYEPDALVTHVVPADRLRLGWVLRRAWGEGTSEPHLRAALAPGAAPTSPARDLGVALFRGWRELARRARRVRDPREAVVGDLCWRVRSLGAAWTLWRADAAGPR